MISDLITGRAMLVMYVLVISFYMLASAVEQPLVGGISREVGFAILSTGVTLIAGVLIAIAKLRVKDGVYRGFYKEATSAQRTQFAWRISAFMAFLAALIFLLIELTLPPCEFTVRGRGLCLTFADGGLWVILKAPTASILPFAFAMASASSLAYAIACIRELIHKEKDR